MRRWSSSTAWYRAVATVVALCGMSVAMTACGDTDDPSAGRASSSGVTATSAGDAAHAATLEKLYAGTYREPRGPVIDEPATGKEVWVIANGMSTEVTVEAVEAVEHASAKLGWKATVFDGKFSPTRQLSGVQQALAAGADGIVAVYVDCPAIKNGLEQARRADVPTINVAGGECSSPGFAHTVAYPGFESYLDYLHAYGRAQADYAIARTDGQAKVLLSTQTDLASIRAEGQGIRQQLESCSGCEVLGDAEFVGADFGPPLQSKISQQLLKHPEANVFIASYDAILTSGGAQAIKSSGRQDELLVVGGEGSVDGIEMIRGDTGMEACLGYSSAMDAYGAVNALVVLFAGRDPVREQVDNGVGYQACDRDHNLPPAGRSFVPPVDYEAVYDRLWSIE